MVTKPTKQQVHEAVARVRGEMANLASAEAKDDGADWGAWYALNGAGYIAAKIEREDVETILSALEG